jgi:hypothetical protein
MTTKIQPFVRGQAPTLLDAERANQLVRVINGLMQSKGTNGIKVSVEGDGRLVISGEILEDLLGEGLPEGFAEETLDVVEDDNTAGQRVFLTKGVV